MESKSLEVITQLLAAGADPGARDLEAKTPLLVCHDADSSVFRGIASLLLTKGADINAQDNQGNTLLHYKAESGDLDSVRCLIENKAIINITSTSGATPLHKGKATKRNFVT